MNYLNEVFYDTLLTKKQSFKKRMDSDQRERQSKKER